MKRQLLAAPAALLLSSALCDQVTAAYTTFGSGCPGTGGSPILPLPSPAATQMGNSNNYYGVARANMRYQQVFDGQDVGTARVMNGHSLRMRNSSYSGGAQTLEIKIGNSTYSPSTITSTFATNITGPQTTVFTKKVYNYPNMTPNTDPAFFGVPFKWDKPFVWSGAPNQHVLVEILNTSAADMRYFPDAFNSNNNVTRVYASSGATATTGTVGRNFGLVMGFHYAGSGNAVPVLSNTGRPILGQSFSVDLSSARPNAGAGLLLGASNTAWGAITLPFGLAVLGAPACNLLVSPDVLFGTAVDANGDASIKLPLPNMPALAGVQFYNQWLVFDTPANNLGLAFSNSGHATLGTQ